MAELKAIGDESLHTKMGGKRAQNVFQGLANKHDRLAGSQSLLQFLDGSPPKLRLQNILKVLFAQQIEAIPSDFAQEHMKEASRKGPTGDISERTEEHHRGHASTALPTLGKTLRVPGEESNLAQGAQFQQ